VRAPWAFCTLVPRLHLSADAPARYQAAMSSIALLADRAAIRDVLLRYARGVDRRDLALVRSLFTADCAYEGQLASGTIEAALAALRTRLDRYAVTMHFMGNQEIALDGDGARSDTLCLAYHRTAEPPADLVTAVRYLDDLVYTPGGWLIRRRRVRLEWSRHDATPRRPTEAPPSPPDPPPSRARR
jgi:hypothetical protein